MEVASTWPSSGRPPTDWWTSRLVIFLMCSGVVVRYQCFIRRCFWGDHFTVFNTWYYLFLLFLDLQKSLFISSHLMSIPFMHSQAALWRLRCSSALDTLINNCILFLFIRYILRESSDFISRSRNLKKFVFCFGSSNKTNGANSIHSHFIHFLILICVAGLDAEEESMSWQRTSTKPKCALKTVIRYEKITRVTFFNWV